MKFCIHCNAQLLDSDVFCDRCGTRQASAPAQVPYGNPYGNMYDSNQQQAYYGQTVNINGTGAAYSANPYAYNQGNFAQPYSINSHQNRSKRLSKFLTVAMDISLALVLIGMLLPFISANRIFAATTTNNFFQMNSQVIMYVLGRSSFIPAIVVVALAAAVIFSNIKKLSGFSFIPSLAALAALIYIGIVLTHSFYGYGDTVYRAIVTFGIGYYFALAALTAHATFSIVALISFIRSRK